MPARRMPMQIRGIKDTAVIGKSGLTLTERKTSIREARREPFNFLGYRICTGRSPLRWSCCAF